MNVTHHIGRATRRGDDSAEWQLTADVGKCAGDPERLYVRLDSHNPLFPAFGQQLHLTIGQARGLLALLQKWQNDGEPCW